MPIFHFMYHFYGKFGFDIDTTTIDEAKSIAHHVWTDSDIVRQADTCLIDGIVVTGTPFDHPEPCTDTWQPGRGWSSERRAAQTGPLPALPFPSSPAPVSSPNDHTLTDWATEETPTPSNADTWASTKVRLLCAIGIVTAVYIGWPLVALVIQWLSQVVNMQH